VDPIEDGLGPGPEKGGGGHRHEHRKQGDDVDHGEHEPASSRRDLRPLDLVEGGEEEHQGREVGQHPDGAGHDEPGEPGAAQAGGDPRSVLLARRAAVKAGPDGQCDQQPGADQFDECVPERVMGRRLPVDLPEHGDPADGVDSEHEGGACGQRPGPGQAIDRTGQDEQLEGQQGRADGGAQGQRQDGRQQGTHPGHAIWHRLAGR
jgi:hypothetical protein